MTDAERVRIDAKWWAFHLRGEDPSSAIHNILDNASTRWSLRRQMSANNAALINADLSAFGTASNSAGNDHEVLSFNALLNCVKTVASKLIQHRTIPFAVTEGGTASERRRAAKFNAMAAGQFQSRGVFENDEQWCMDALTFEAGVAKVFAADGVVNVERVFAFELWVDDIEARRGWKGVRTLYFRTPIDREVLLARYADAKPEVLESLKGYELSSADKSLYQIQSDADMVLVTEAYHLPSAKGKDDGRYVICFRGGTLVDEPYTKNRFPFAFLYQDKPLTHVWQYPLVSRITAPQREYDTGKSTIQDAVRYAIPKLLVSNNEGKTKVTVDDELGQIIEYESEAPVYLTPQPIHPDYIRYVNEIPNEMLRYEGISEMSANGMVPRGMNGASGKALQIFDDSYSERLAPFAKNRQQFYCEIGELMLDALRDLAAENNGLVVELYNNKTFKLCKFSEIDLGEGKYKFMVQPASVEYRSLSSKMQQAGELFNMGAINLQEYRRMLGIPDLVAVNQLDTAPIENVDAIIETILDTGEVPGIFPTNNLDIILDRAGKAVELAYLNEEDEEKIAALNEFIIRARAEKEKITPPPAAPPMAPPGPMTPPVPPPGDPNAIG